MRSSAVLGAPDGAETNSGSVKAAPLSGQVALHSGDSLPRTAAPDAFTDASTCERGPVSNVFGLIWCE